MIWIWNRFMIFNIHFTFPSPKNTYLLLVLVCFFGLGFGRLCVTNTLTDRFITTQNSACPSAAASQQLSIKEWTLAVSACRPTCARYPASATVTPSVCQWNSAAYSACSSGPSPGLGLLLLPHPPPSSTYIHIFFKLPKWLCPCKGLSNPQGTARGSQEVLSIYIWMMSAEIFRWHLTSRFANTEPLTVSFRGELRCVPAATVSARNRPSKKPHTHVSAV